MKRYSKEFKEEALKLSDEIGVKKAAQQLGVAYYTQPAWAAACEVPGVDAGAAGSLTGAAELFRFWVFPDCTFLDISIIYERKCSQAQFSTHYFHWHIPIKALLTVLILQYNDESFLPFLFFFREGLNLIFYLIP